MRDANESADDDDFYSRGDDDAAGPAYEYDSDDDAEYEFIDYDSDDSDDPIFRRHKLNCTILSELDIRQRQEEDITNISTVLSISKVSASVLLRFYNWSVSKVYDEWFADEEKVRKSVGLLEKPVVAFPNAKELTCGICFETYPCGSLHAAACDHLFCNTCWTGYISASINDGPGCLMLRCPGPSCGAAIDQDMINLLASDEDREKYSRYFIRSYVEDNRKIKWCPAPGCDFAVEFVVGCGNYDVTCCCSCRFCWNCTKEVHRPFDCGGTVAKRVFKNIAESENMNWILANSQPCPRCMRPIEKNQGCMHMTCTPSCKFEFCWLCLGPWSEHRGQTCGFYMCNPYQTAKQEGVSRQKALEDLQRMLTVRLEKLSDVQCQPKSQLEFITEAGLQIFECRWALKWMIAYGYKLPEHEHAKRQLFDYLLGVAESLLERLCQCAEKELQGYVNAEGPSKDFNEFRTKLARLTSAARSYFENLVRYLENGLPDVDTHPSCSRQGNSKTWE